MAEDDRTRRLEEANKALETRLVDLERRLMAEREKVLETEVRQQEKEAVSVGVETALKDMQDKLRREKREQELEAARQAAEARVRDLERRLGEERDMWVTMMKEHLARGGDTKPLIAEIAVLKADLIKKQEEIAGLKGQALKDGGDQKALQLEISSLKDMMEKQASALAAREDELRLLKGSLSAKDKERERQGEELNLKLTSLQQALAEKEMEMQELQRQTEALRQKTEPPDNAEFKKRFKEQEAFHEKLSSRIAELEKEVGRRDALIESVRAENGELQKKTSQSTAAKDAEARLLRENLQRLGRQNKELLEKLREAADAGAMVPAPGPVSQDMKEMLSDLEDALTNRDRMLEHQQKSIDEKRGLIEGLFTDLKSLDEQAVALLEEKNRQSREMNERVGALESENERLKRLLEARPTAPPPEPPPHG